MRVAIEAAALGLSSGGLARYTGELSLALARTFPADDFYLTSDRPFDMPPGAPVLSFRGHAGAAQEPRDARGGVARGAGPVSGRPRPGRPQARGFSRAAGGARTTGPR